MDGCPIKAKVFSIDQAIANGGSTLYVCARGGRDEAVNKIIRDRTADTLMLEDGKATLTFGDATIIVQEIWEMKPVRIAPSEHFFCDDVADADYDPDRTKEIAQRLAAGTPFEGLVSKYEGAAPLTDEEVERIADNLIGGATQRLVVEESQQIGVWAKQLMDRLDSLGTIYDTFTNHNSEPKDCSWSAKIRGSGAALWVGASAIACG